MTRPLAERLAALSILLFALAYLWLAFSIKVPASSDDSPFSARSFPLILGPVAALLALILLVRPPSGAAVGVGLKWGRGLGLITLMGVYALAITRLGFVVTSSLFLTACFLLLGERRPLVLALASVGVSLGFWAMFWMLDVKLDWGWFGRALS